MNKRMKMVAMCGLTLAVVVGSAPEAHAGIIPWTYNAIFGPVGSTFGHRRAAYPPAYQYQAAYQPAYSMGMDNCNTCNYGSYSAGYVPYYGSYSYGNGCNTCAPCVSGCATGNCTSNYTPATGITPTPDNSVSPTPNAPTPTPTQTFRSSEPTVTTPNNGSSAPATFDNSGTSGGFEQPTRPNEAPKENAPLFGAPASGLPSSPTPPATNPFGGSSIESRKVPTEDPMVPVEQRQPAPAQLEGSGSSVYPELRIEPAPVALDTTSAHWKPTAQVIRTARKAQYQIPVVARSTPASNPMLPPLPAPLQLVGK